AVEKGLQPAEIIAMSALVYAGASQYVAIELWATPLPYLTMVLSVFAVNFRHILYSASIGRKLHRFSRWQKSAAFFGLVDPQWAVMERRAVTRDLTWSFYAGMAVPLYCSWVTATAFGVAFGRLIENPAAFGLDFLLPIYFLALLMGFRERPRWLPVVFASATVGTLFYVFVGPPWHVATGAFAGIGLAALMAGSEKAA
ncbi:MAG: AzlC family ABC transporter permease, partial [Pseudomonadota bacterium]